LEKKKWVFLTGRKKAASAIRKEGKEGFPPEEKGALITQKGKEGLTGLLFLAAWRRKGEKNDDSPSLGRGKVRFYSSRGRKRGKGDLSCNGKNRALRINFSVNKGGKRGI